MALGFQGLNLGNEARHANKGDHMNNMNVQSKAFKHIVLNWKWTQKTKQLTIPIPKAAGSCFEAKKTLWEQIYQKF